MSNPKISFKSIESKVDPALEWDMMHGLIGEIAVNVTITDTSIFLSKTWIKVGMTLSADANQWYVTARIPCERYEELVNLPGVLSVEYSRATIGPN